MQRSPQSSIQIGLSSRRQPLTDFSSFNMLSPLSTNRPDLKQSLNKNNEMNKNNETNKNNEMNKNNDINEKKPIKSNEQLFKSAYSIAQQQAEAKKQIMKQYPEEQKNQKTLSFMDFAKKVISDNQYSKEQLDYHISNIQNMWQYRYERYVQYGYSQRKWLKLFSFLGEFKQRCITIVKKLINSNLKAYKCLQDIDYRCNMKNDGEQGIYLIDGIIFRLAKIKYYQAKDQSKSKSQLSKQQAKKQKQLKQNEIKQKQKDVDEVAVKGLHQQFLAYNVLNNLYLACVKEKNVNKVKVPLTVLVKYLGFTVLCQADTSCEGLQTLIHGPTSTIYQYREQSIPILKQIGQQLNLRDFKMLSKDGKVLTIPFSLTVELHRVTKQIKNDTVLQLLNPKSVLYPSNGKLYLDKPEYYLLNIRKLWPLFIDSDIMKSSGYLRPQVVLGWKTKLSNTVFSRVAYKQDPNTQLQLADACKTLKQDNVKILARVLDNTTIFLVDSQGIQEIMHEYGVNLRFMGELANKVTLQFSRKVLEIQMIARVCKKYFFPVFNQLIEGKQIKDLTGYLKETFVDFLNLLFIRNSDGEKFYKKYLYQKIKNYYQYDMKVYPPNISGGGLIHALAYHFGIKVKVIDYPFFQAGVDMIFNASHITDVIGFAKTFDMDTAQVKLICKKFKQKRKKNRMDQCISQLRILSSLNRALNHEKTHNIGPYKQSYFNAQLAQIYFELKEYEKAKSFAELSIKGIPEKHVDAIKPFGVLVKYYSVKKEINRCIEFYEKSLGYLSYHLSSDHPLSISVYNTLGYEFVQSMDPSKCQKIFMKSFQICQQALGYMHHTSSQILMQLAGLPLPPQKTINFLLQSLTILQNLGEHQVLIKQVSMRISEQYEKLGNIQKMIYFARKSNHWMMQIKGEDKLHHDKSVFELTNRVPTNRAQVQFLIYFAVKSYLFGLQKLSKDTIYKVFVSYKQLIIPKQIASPSLLRRMTSDRSNLNSVSDFIKNNFIMITRQVSKKLSKYHFYITRLQDWDKYLRGLIEVFIQIMSTIGQDAEQMFLTYRKTF